MNLSVCYAHRSDKFTTFVAYILSEAQKGNQLDTHWRPQADLCGPCHVTYDFIGHYETLYPDADYVLTQIAGKSQRPFLRSDPDNQHRKSTTYVREFYSKVPRRYIEGLLRLYSADYQLFGFTVPDVSRMGV